MLAAAASLPLHAGFLAAHRPPAPIITTRFVERGALPSVAANLALPALVPQKLAAFGALSFSPFEVFAAFLLGGAFSTSIFAAEGLRVAFGPKNVHRVRAVLAVALKLVIARPPTGLAAHPPAQGHSLGLMGEPSPLRGCGGALLVRRKCPCRLTHTSHAGAQALLASHGHDAGRRVPGARQGRERHLQG